MTPHTSVAFNAVYAHDYGGARSSLFYHQARIWAESGAPYLLWENVYGALSSNGGRDFASIVSTLVGAAIAVPSDGWRRGGVASGPAAVAAWRVLDLQHLGPPQRRARVFVLAARTGGVDPAEILALGEGVCGHAAPRAQTGQKVTGTLGARINGGGGFGGDFECDGGVVAVETRARGGDDPPVLVARLVSFGEYAVDGTASTISSRDYKSATDLVVVRAQPRRLVPVECERLMSWPDGHTAYGVTDHGVRYALSDTARYRLCGNGVASVQVQWIAERFMTAIRGACGVRVRVDA